MLKRNCKIIKASRAAPIMIDYMKICGHKKKLDRLLTTIVDDTLQEIFKDVGAAAIYRFLEEKSQLRREEIAEKPKIFSTSLERLLGSGAPVIEKLILRKLHSALNLEFNEKAEYDFLDCIMELRR